MDIISDGKQRSMLEFLPSPAKRSPNKLIYKRQAVHGGISKSKIVRTAALSCKTTSPFRSQQLIFYRAPQSSLHAETSITLTANDEVLVREESEHSAAVCRFCGLPLDIAFSSKAERQLHLRIHTEKNDLLRWPVRFTSLVAPVNLHDGLSVVKLSHADVGCSKHHQGIFSYVCRNTQNCVAVAHFEINQDSQLLKTRDAHAMHRLAVWKDEKSRENDFVLLMLHADPSNKSNSPSSAKTVVSLVWLEELSLVSRKRFHCLDGTDSHVEAPHNHVYGIRLIWTQREHRRRGLAMRLLDYVVKNCRRYGMFRLTPEMLVFSEPSADGLSFMMQWVKRKNLPGVYSYELYDA